MSSSVKNLGGGGGSSGDAGFDLIPLWENTNTGSNVFREQTVPLDMSSYDEFIIFWIDEWRSEYVVTPVLCRAAKIAYLSKTDSKYTSGTMDHYSGDYYRRCSIENNGIKFTDVSTVSGYNRYCVPMLIYGVEK